MSKIDEAKKKQRSITATVASSDEQVPPRQIAAPNAVTIFGAGVTGLSAAHELVERGFRVQVWEPKPSERSPASGCDVGGMAKTQWCSVPWKEGEREEDKEGEKEHDLGARREQPVDWASRQAGAIIELPWVFYLTEYPQNFTVVAAIGRLGFTSKEDEARGILQEMARDLLTQDKYGCLRNEGKQPGSVVYCEVQRRTPLEKPGEERIAQVIAYLNGQLEGVARVERSVGGYTEQVTTKLTNGSNWIEFRLALLDGFPEDLPHRFGERISFRVRDRWLPGEHGFRFFPAFYHHLFDTMKRTPILEPAPKSPLGAAQERSVSVNANPDKYVETGRTAFDNLRPTESQALAFSDGGLPAVLSRSAPKSLKDVRRWLNVIFNHPAENAANEVEGGYGLTPRDVALFALKMFQYMTSCERRREEYGKMTWLEYLGGESAYSKRFVKLVNDSPKALVAMDARTSDARTQGSVFTQLMLDNTRDGGFRDGTLSGPTSVAWLEPWRRYLEAQGVEFIHGEITGFEVRADPDGCKMMWPTVACYEPRYPGADTGTPALAPGYFLLALPPLEAQRNARKYCKEAGANGRGLDPASDLYRLADMYLLADPHDREQAAPRGALRHMVGIQYYFDEDAYWLDGHYYLPLSPWGISAISQARFWQDKADWEHGYRGVLSVGITSMDVDGVQIKQKAWNCTPAEIAEEVWEQMSSALNVVNQKKQRSLPKPRYFHLDFNLQGKRDGGGNSFENTSPLLVNLPGEWERRPGDLVKPSWLGTEQQLSGYDVTDGIVLAGNYMKTFTRLTTMEGANESARHAVNAIIQDRANRDASACAPCDIWPIEDREVDDFDFLKELDDQLYGRNLEHFVEILELDDAIVNALRGGGPKSQDPFDPLWILAELDRIFGDHGRKLIKNVLNQGVGS